MNDTLLAPFVIYLALATFGVLVLGLVFVVRDTIRQRGRWGINLSPPACKHCGTPPPLVRTPANFSQAIRRQRAELPAPPPPPDDSDDLEHWLAPLREKYPAPTPLDES